MTHFNRCFSSPILRQKVTRDISGCVTCYFEILSRVTFRRNCHGCHGLLRSPKIVTGYWVRPIASSHSFLLSFYDHLQNSINFRCHQVFPKIITNLDLPLLQSQRTLSYSWMWQYLDPHPLINTPDPSIRHSKVYVMHVFSNLVKSKFIVRFFPIPHNCSRFPLHSPLEPLKQSPLPSIWTVSLVLESYDETANWLVAFLMIFC